MREQEEDLLREIASIENDPLTGAPPLSWVRENGRTGRVGLGYERDGIPMRLKASAVDLGSLNRQDLIRADGRPFGTTGCKLRLTKKGREAYEEGLSTITVLEPLLEGGEDVLNWTEEVVPVLKAAYEAYSRQPLSYGIATNYVNEILGRPEGDPRTNLVLAALSEDGYIVATIDGEHGMPHMFKLAERARQVVAGWPGGSDEDRIQGLLSSLDAQIERTENEDERGRLRQLREAITDLGTDLAAKILTNVITGV
jgi:hypothetical protein